MIRETRNVMKFSNKVSAFAVAAALVASSSFAQSDISSSAAGASIATIGGKVESGMKSVLNGQIDDLNNNSVGAYVRPAFDIGLDFSPVDVSLSYILTAVGARGFGDGNSTKAVANNSYFEHNPTLFMSGALTSDWSTSMLVDVVYKNTTGDQSNNELDIVVQPTLTYALTDSVTIGASYFFERYTNQDARGGRTISDDNENLQNARASLSNNSEDAAKSIAITAADAAVESQELLHAGVITVGAKLADNVSLTTYVRAGKNFVNKDGADQMAYRLNSDLKVKPTKDLSLALRYRLNISDDLSSDTRSVYNRGRIIASYAIAKSWALDLENQATYTSNNTKADSFKNEQYLGVSYNF